MPTDAKRFPWRFRLRYTPRVPAMWSRMLAAVAGSMLVLVTSVASAQQPAAPKSSTVLTDLGFTLSTPGLDKNSITFTDRGLLVPTPWGLFEATVVSTPVDRMVRVPLSPNGEPGNQRIQPYVTAGSRKNVDDDSVLEQLKPVSFAETPRTDVKAGAGVLFKLDDNVELFGEYQFMRLRKDDGRGVAGPLGTTLDAGGFSLGISVRY